MRQAVAAGIALLICNPTLAFADAKRGSEAFSQGDYLTADREWRDASDTGDAAAMLGLGVLYDTGHGERQNFAEALYWYRRAAEAGNARAMFNVGAMYDNGRGTAVNRAEAVRWYAMSAARGEGRAAYAVATIYRDGDGVPRNTAAAVKFFKIAAAAGIGAARSNLASLGQGALPDAARPSSPPDGAPKLPDSASTMVKRPATTPSATADAGLAKAELPPAMPPDVPAKAVAPTKDVATAEPARPLAAEPPAPTLEPPTSPKRKDFAVAAASIPAPPKPSTPTPIQPAAAGTAGEPAAAGVTSAIERFHKIALQRSNVSPGVSKQYEGVFSEVAHKALQGDDAAQYDTGFAYERGIGVPPDLTRSYVYYIRATLSSDIALRSAALRAAFEIGGRLTDSQQASAADILTHGAP